MENEKIVENENSSIIVAPAAAGGSMDVSAENMKIMQTYEVGEPSGLQKHVYLKRNFAEPSHDEYNQDEDEDEPEDEHEHEDEDEDEDEDEEVTTAALTLIHMKHAVLDSKTANQLMMSMIPKRTPTTTSIPTRIPARTRFACAPSQGLSNGLLPKLVEPKDIVGENCSTGIEKELTESDIKSNQMRLLLPRGYADTFVRQLLREHEDIKQGINVTVYDNQLVEHPMKYKIWSNKKSPVLTTGWKEFHGKCNLKMGQKVRLWPFRHPTEDKLCFVIIRASDLCR